MQNLHGKTAFITGASSGIGRALAIQLAGKGVKVLICDVREELLQETQRIIQDNGGKSFAYTLDVSQKEAFYTLSKRLIEEHKSIDIVINNAGVSLGTYPLDEVTIDNFEWLMGINFWGVVYGSQSFLPHLKSRPIAWIVNISSVFGLAGIAGQTPYCASKFAVRGFTEALRMELLGTNIIPVTVHPGGIKTNIVRFGRNKDEKENEKLAQNFDKNARTTPEQAAATIIKGIESQKRKILIGTDALFFNFITRLLPVAYSRILGYIMKKVM